MKNSRSAFTLVELLMVIAIIAMISALAVQKFGGLKVGAQDDLNRANLVRILSTLETHAAANPGRAKFDKLDALVIDGAPDHTPGGATDGLSSTSALLLYTNQGDKNRGLAPELVGDRQNPYAGTSAGILGTYYLSDSEVRALERDIGLRTVMRGYPETLSVPYYTFCGDDGVYVAGRADSADTCSSVARTNHVGMAVAAINPGATLDDTYAGASIYKACGIMGVAYSGTSYKVMLDGAECSSNEDAFTKLRKAGEQGGILLAFGLGEHCALVGSSVAGLDTAPVSPVMNKDEYRRYIVLVRMVYDASGAAKRAEFAGVMDPRGRTAAMLR